MRAAHGFATIKSCLAPKPLGGRCPDCDNFLPWVPIVDGISVPRSPAATIRLGEHHRVPTIVSTVATLTVASYLRIVVTRVPLCTLTCVQMRNETLAFLPTLIEKVGDNALAYELLMDALYKDRASAVKEVAPLTHVSPLHIRAPSALEEVAPLTHISPLHTRAPVLVQHVSRDLFAQHYASTADTAEIPRGARLLGVASTDSLMTCYARRLAKLLSPHAPTYLSTFLYAPHASEMAVDALCVAGGPDGASCHAGDVAYLFPQSARMSARSGIAYQGGEASFALTYSRSVVAFAAGALHPFVPYEAGADVSTAWNITGPTTARSYHGSHCDFFESAGFPSHPWGEDGEAPESLTV